MKDLDIDALEVVGSDEDPMAVECKNCGSVAMMDVDALAVPSPLVPPGDELRLGELTMRCVGCDVPFTYFPRPEWSADGEHLLLWRDRSVIEEFAGQYHGNTYMQLELKDPRTGARGVLTSGAGGETWGYCESCGLPFRFKGSMAWTGLIGGAGMDLRVGPCTHCDAMGGPALTSSFTAGGMTTTSGSANFATLIGLLLVQQAADGELDLSVAVEALRGAKIPVLSSLADWIEARPVSMLVVTTILGVAATLIAPHIDAPDSDQAPTVQFTDNQIREILESMMDQYDREMRRGGPGGEPRGQSADDD